MKKLKCLKKNEKTIVSKSSLYFAYFPQIGGNAGDQQFNIFAPRNMQDLQIALNDWLTRGLCKTENITIVPLEISEDLFADIFAEETSELKSKKLLDYLLDINQQFKQEEDSSKSELPVDAPSIIHENINKKPEEPLYFAYVRQEQPGVPFHKMNRHTEYFLFSPQPKDKLEENIQALSKGENFRKENVHQIRLVMPLDEYHKITRDEGDKPLKSQRIVNQLLYKTQEYLKPKPPSLPPANPGRNRQGHFSSGNTATVTSDSNSIDDLQTPYRRQ